MAFIIPIKLNSQSLSPSEKCVNEGRHAQCDLHTTTDVVLHPELNAKCTVPFETGVEPKCCASDFTLDEIRTLCGKMDSSGSINATTPEEYVFGGTADWRTDLYQYPCPTIPTHKESIELIRSYHGKFTPELKAADVEMPFEGTFTQENYAQKMIDEYVEAGVEPSDVWPQSFNHLDVIYWVENTDFGGQAVALHEENSTESEFRALHSMLKENGVKIVAPPLWMLVEYDNSTELGIVPSAYSDSAKENGLAIITWTLERTPPGLDGWYWQTLENMTRTDGDNFALLHVLSQDVGVIGVFSDWPATTTFYANCMDLGLRQDGSGSTSEGDASAQASPAVGKQRHLSAASQFVNIALKLAGI
jgi:glycerophosphoryl diester phosphodiesterase